MRFLVIASTVAACLVGIEPALATPIGPGGVVAAAAVPNPAGTLIADTGLMSFSFGSPLSTGTIREIVVEDASNPFGAGDLSFIFQARLDTGDLARITGSSFAGFLTDVGVSVPLPPFFTSGTAVPTTITRSAGAGDVIGFDFAPGLVPDGGSTDTSLELIVRTNASMFAPGSIGVVDGGGQTLFGFAPIPEPGALLLLGSGIGGLALFGRRRG